MVYSLALSAVHAALLTWLVVAAAGSGWTLSLSFNAYGEGPVELVVFPINAVLTALALALWLREDLTGGTKHMTTDRKSGARTSNEGSAPGGR